MVARVSDTLVLLVMEKTVAHVMHLQQLLQALLLQIFRLVVIPEGHHTLSLVSQHLVHAVSKLLVKNREVQKKALSLQEQI
jgi:hypothetical protein